MNLNETEIYLIVDSLETKLYENIDKIKQLKKRENNDTLIDFYEEEIFEIKNLLIKLENQ